MADLDVSELVGLADLLDTAPEQAIRAAHGAGIAVGAKIHQAAKAAAPENTGWLRSKGIRRRSWRTKDACHTDVFTVPDEQGHNVGFFVEYGTSKMPPRPFLSSQMVAGGPAYEAAVLDALDPLVKPGPEPTE